MTPITSRSLRSCCMLLLLVPIVATEEPRSPSQGGHPSTNPSLLPHWVSPSGIYNSLLSGHGPTRCSAKEGFQGICEAVEKCTSHGGVFRSSRICSREGKVCCSVHQNPIATCNELIERSGDHFVNTADENITEYCGVLVRIPPSVCTLRLDFLAFKISQPAMDIEDKAQCTDDVFSVHSGSSSVAIPNLCGDNDNQHLLIGVNGSEHVYLNMRFAPYLVEVQRYWNIRVSFEKCDSPELAPAGCLQRHSTRNGAIRPFNYGPSNRLIEGLKYQVCLIPKASTCQILMKNRFHNIRGPVFLNFVTQRITSVSIGPLYVIKNDTTQISTPVRSCPRRMGKSLQAQQSPVAVEPMRHSMEETSPKLLEWLISGSVKSLEWDYLKSARRAPPEDDEDQIEDSSGMSEAEERMSSSSGSDDGFSDERIMTEDSDVPELPGADPKQRERFAKFVLEVPLDGITPSLQNVLAEDDYVTELLRTHDHENHTHHAEHNITHIVPEHPDRAWIQQLHEQRTKAVMDRLNALAQNHANSSHHGGAEHHNSSAHHGSLDHHGGSKHHGSPDHHGSLEHNGTLCHRGSHAHPNLPPCEPEGEGSSTTPAPVILTTIPPPEIFEDPMDQTQLVIDESEDKKEEEDDGPDPSIPPLIVELKKTKENSTEPEAPTCDGFKLPTNVTEKCVEDTHPEKCYFDRIHSHRNEIQDNISECNYTAPQILAHQHEFEEQVLQQYHVLTKAIHKHPPHPTHKPHTAEHAHPTHQPHTGEHTHPTHPPLNGHPSHTAHNGHHSQHSGHTSGSAKPNRIISSTSGSGIQMVVPVVVYVPVKSTIHNQYNHEKIYHVNANLTQLLEESLRNASSHKFLVEIGSPREAGDGQPEIMTFNDQFELLYSFETC